MDTIKQYTFIKPDNLTIDEKYKIYETYKDICEYYDMKKEEFYEVYKDRDSLGIALTYHMIKYQTTLVDFLVTTCDNRTIKIDGMIVDNNTKYKKRAYKIKTSEDLKTGDNVIFIKHMVGWGWYIACTEIEDKDDKSTLRHITKST
jgi:hypothetical protein